ncbi:hypothetical protein BV133_3108 [Blastochloris viridis]|uniref:Uncharacterized protein n=1 Tax=Blastochloris viridis TaxID=1079 RepID=A0A182D6Y6_BLAVI|nr:hypothetical protein BV133_3108 [Blastochloris viridis]
MKVVDDQRSARPHPERILIVGDRAALCRGQDRHVTFGDLVEFTALPAQEGLIVDRSRRSLTR